jgi:trigger factor
LPGLAYFPASDVHPKTRNTMEIKVESPSSIKRRILITIDAEYVKSERNKLFKKVSKQAQIRGFRPGKAPRALLERHYGDHVNEELSGDLMEEALKKAVEDNDIKLVARPEIESSELKEDGSFVASALVEVYPEVEPKEYTGLSIKRQKVSVPDSVLEKQLQGLAEKHSYMEPVEEDRPAQAEDFVEIDIAFQSEGKEIFKEEGTIVPLGEDAYLPGLTEGIAGMKPGEEKTIKTTLPDNFWKAEFVGKEAEYKVKLHAIKNKVTPELDDEFAKDISADFTSMADLREAEAKKLEDEFRNMSRGHDRGELVKALLVNNEVEVPESMVERQLDFLVEQWKYRMMYSGVPQNNLEDMAETARERMRDNAADEVKAVLIFEAIAEKEKIEVTDDDLQKRYEELAGASGRTALEVSADYQKQGRVEELKHVIREEMAMDFLFESAEVEWVDPPTQDAEPAQETSEETSGEDEVADSADAKPDDAEETSDDDETPDADETPTK